MTVEMIESFLRVSEEVAEVNPLEPKAVFLVKNGTGKEREMTVTLSSWKAAAHLAIEEREKIKGDQGRVRERGQVMSKRKTTRAGKTYSSPEKNQILSLIEKDRKIIDSAMKINRRGRTFLARQGNWLLVSPSQRPLKVRVKDAGDDELVAGEPLNEREAAWRMFVLQEGEAFASHPDVRIVREFFGLRRDAFFQNEEKPGEAAEKLDEFRRKISNDVPDELVPVFRKINKFDFREPLLSELEILQKEN